MKVTYTEEAVADMVEAITYLNERNPTVAVNLDAEDRDHDSRERDRDDPRDVFLDGLELREGLNAKSSSTVITDTN